MSKEFRIFIATLLGLVVATLIATDDPETGAEGLDNPWVLVAIATFVALATLRALKKMRV